MKNNRIPQNLRYRGPVEDEDVDAVALVIAAISAVGAMVLAGAFFALMWWIISIIS